MAQERSISEIITIARISQYLAGNDIANKTFLKGGALDPKLDRTLFMERYAIEKVYELIPDEVNLRKAANYLFALCGKYAYQAEEIINDNTGTAPVVNGPGNQTINISGTASFTISVTSATPYTIAWYKNGELVPGETGLNYSYAATISDNGDTVSAIATNPKGSTSSVTATLTVTNVLEGYWWYGNTDNYADLLAGIDDLDYQITFDITPSSGVLIVDVPSEAANNKYNVCKYPVSQGLMTKWANTPLNLGSIPDSVYHSIVTIGSFYYIISREAMSFDDTSNVIYSLT